MKRKNVWGAVALCASLVSGVPSSSAWTIVENFDKSPAGTLPSTTNFKWFSGTKVSSEFKYGGSGNGASLFITGGESGYGEFGGYGKFPTTLKPGDEVWYRVRTFMPTSFDYTSSTYALKFMRVHTSKADGSNRGYLDLYIRPAGDYIYQSEIYPGQIKEKFSEQDSLSLWSGDSVKKGVWETYEVYYKFATSNGTVRIWKNGKLVYQNQKWETLASDSDRVDAAYLFTYWNGHAPKSQTMYVDDLFVTNERPSNRDAAGNYYIGMGGVVTTQEPVAPSPPQLRLN